MRNLPEIITQIKPLITYYIQNNMFYRVSEILSDSFKSLSKSSTELTKFSNRYTEHECVVYKNKILSCGSGEIALATSLVFYRNLYGELPSKVLIIKPVKMSSIKIIFEVYEARFENYKFVDKKKLCDVHVVRVRIPIPKNAEFDNIVEKIKSIHPRAYLTHLITSNKHSDYVNVFFLTKHLNISNVSEDVKKLLAESNLSKFIQ